MIVFPAGQDYSHNLACRDAQGSVISLAGATAVSLKIYPYPREGAALVDELFVDDGLAIDTPSNGIVTFTADADGDHSIPVGTYTAELWGTLASSQRLPLIIEELRVWGPEGN